MSPRDELLAALQRAGYSLDAARDLIARETAPLRQQLNTDSDYEALLRDERDYLAAQLTRVRAQITRWRYTPDRKRAAEELAAELDPDGEA